MHVGFVGLGAMGWPMAANLSRAGLLHGVFNRSFDKAESFAQEFSVQGYKTLADLTACDVVVLCVPADQEVLNISEQLAGVLPKSAIVIDCSTVESNTAKRAAQILAENQVGFIDAPVSGGTEGAKNGTLAIMAGGSTQDYERVLPVLQCLGKKIVHMGPVGSGQATKAANQVACAGINQAVTEALAFAQAHDLPMDKVIDVMSSGAAGNWFLEHRGPTMVEDQFPLGFKVSLHAKDLGICQAMAEQYDAKLPIVEMTLIHYQRLLQQGHGDKDISSLFKLKRDLFDSDGP